jgi:hypothetical protein
MEREALRQRCHVQLTDGCLVRRAIEFGKANPAAIIQTNPGNLVSGTRDSARMLCVCENVLLHPCLNATNGSSLLARRAGQ